MMASTEAWFRCALIAVCIVCSLSSNGVSSATASVSDSAQSTTSLCDTICQTIPSDVTLACSISCLTPSSFAPAAISSENNADLPLDSQSTSDQCQQSCTAAATQRCNQVCASQPNGNPATFFPQSPLLPKTSSLDSSSSSSPRTFSLSECQSGCSGAAQTSCLNSPMCAAQQNATVCETRCAAQLVACNNWCNDEQSSWEMQQRIAVLVSQQQEQQQMQDSVAPTSSETSSPSARLNRQSSSATSSSSSPSSSSSTSSSSSSTIASSPGEILAAAAGKTSNLADRAAAIQAATDLAISNARTREATLNAARANSSYVPPPVTVNSTADPMAARMQAMGFVYVCIDDPYAVAKVNVAKKQESLETNKQGQSVSQLRQAAQQQISEGQALRAKGHAGTKHSSTSSSSGSTASTTKKYHSHEHVMVSEDLYKRAAAKAAYYESLGNPSPSPHVQQYLNQQGKPVKTLDTASRKKYCGEQCDASQRACVQQKTAATEEEHPSTTESEASRYRRQQNQNYREVAAMYQCERLKNACVESCTKSLDYAPVPPMPEHLRAPVSPKKPVQPQQARQHQRFHTTAATAASEDTSTSSQTASTSDKTTPSDSSPTADVTALPPLASEVAAQNVTQHCQWVTPESAKKAGLVWTLPNGELSNSTATSNSTSSTTNGSSSDTASSSSSSSDSSASSSSSTSSSTSQNQNKNHNNQNQNQNQKNNNSNNSNKNQQKNAKKSTASSPSKSRKATGSSSHHGSRFQPMEYPDMSELKTGAEREAAHEQFIAARNAAIQRASEARRDLS